ncbi:hypothetical protein V8167_000187 [Providencia rettgeri]|nr:hypothetical protein [Providencia rettgeri]ELR5280470.1 hypothetical protein [Providencia rettgeri]HEM8141171.1 hypothetical protein [Providencia rettgeri]
MLSLPSLCQRFQVDYEYRACQSGKKGKIIDLTVNNAGICDTARTPQHIY